MIKISLRPNLIYPIYLIMWTLLRKIVTIILAKFYKFNGSVVYTFLMFLGEIIGGLFFYLYQKGYFEKKIKSSMQRESKLNDFLITNEVSIKIADSNKKKLFLIIMTGFFDFFQFVLTNNYNNKIIKKSLTLETRLGGILIAISSLICKFTLRIPILKHQILSLIIIGICLVILIISESFFQKFDIFISTKNFIFAILFSILSHGSIALNNTIEKYIIDIDLISPFKVLFMQGILGVIIIIIYSIFNEPFSELKKIHDVNSSGMFILFIFLLLFYTIFGMFKNIYRMTTIMLFSPMNKHLADFIINPLYIIYYFVVKNDFMITENKGNYFYFFTNLILLIIFDICGLIYNEFLVINCCGLERNTYNSIVFRASKFEELESICDNESEEL